MAGLSHDEKAAFAARLAEAMEARGVANPERLAIRLGVGASRVHKWARGATLPDYEGLIVLARWSGRSADWWLGLGDELNPSAEATAALHEDLERVRERGAELANFLDKMAADLDALAEEGERAALSEAEDEAVEAARARKREAG